MVTPHASHGECERYYVYDYIHIQYAYFWEVDGPEILQNYKEFMNSLSHQVFCTHQLINNFAEDPETHRFSGESSVFFNCLSKDRFDCSNDHQNGSNNQTTRCLVAKTWASQAEFLRSK